MVLYLYQYHRNHINCLEDKSKSRRDKTIAKEKFSQDDSKVHNYKNFTLNVNFKRLVQRKKKVKILSENITPMTVF